MEKQLHLPHGDYIYPHVKKMIHKLCYKAQRRFGGELEDWEGQAGLHFAMAHQSYRSDKGAKYTSWVQTKVWCGLLEAARKRTIRWRHEQHRVDLDLDAMAAQREQEQFDLYKLLREVSDDAREAIHLAMELPKKGKILKGKRGRKESTSNKRTILIESLFEKGWSAARIIKVFQEIRRSI